MKTWSRRRLVIVALATIAVLALGYFGVARWRVSHPRPAGPVRVTAQPGTIWIEAGEGAQFLNFDFVIANEGATSLGIDSIEVTAFDGGGKLIVRRFIDSNGFAPSIATIPARIVEPGARILVFNPFHTFPGDVDLHRLIYKLNFSIPQEAPETSAVVTIEPRVYRSKTALALPLKGKLLIHDGHDFYAHHRRLDTEHPVAKGVGLTTNFMRFALDITPTSGERFEPFRGTGATNEEWYGWEQPVYASGDGLVVAALAVERDNMRGGKSFFDPGEVKASPMKFYGNHVVIDHGNGELSLVGHLREGSVLVKVGDRVTQGQVIAKIGSSGSSNNPHVHYELRTGAGLDCEGLPATFRGYRRHRGAKVVEVEAAPVDTGDLLENP